MIMHFDVIDCDLFGAGRGTGRRRIHARAGRRLDRRHQHKTYITSKEFCHRGTTRAGPAVILFFVLLTLLYSTLLYSYSTSTSYWYQDDIPIICIIDTTTMTLFRVFQARASSCNISGSGSISNNNYSLRRFLSSAAAHHLRRRPAWLKSSTYSYFQNGQFVESMGEAAHPVRNPATNEIVGMVPEMSTLEFDTVVELAHDAFHQEWKHVSVSQRQRYMLQFQALIRDKKNMDDLAYLITLENGKTLADARGDITRGLEMVESACWMAPHLLGDSLAGISTTMDCISYREPLGVCAGICPFNFPAMSKYKVKVLVLGEIRTGWTSRVDDMDNALMLLLLLVLPLLFFSANCTTTHYIVLLVPLWMFPLAITAGNTFILKPSEKTPGAALFLAELLASTGLPEGVLQVVQGAKHMVDQICTHPQISAISFVGSNTAGQYIHQQGTQHGKRVQANLGAKNHAVILPDTTTTTTTSTNQSQSSSNMMDATTTALVGAAFGAAGQRCMALSTLVLVGTTEDETKEWMNSICTKAAALQVGPGMDPSSDIGPLITAESKQRVISIIDQAVEQGAVLELDGRPTTQDDDDHDHHSMNKGNFLRPTVLFNITTSNIAYTQEIFGPVLVCLRVDTLQDAIDLINHDNPYGNGCALFTSNGSAARYFTHHVHVGQVGINVPIPVPLPMFSFTGNRASIRGDLNFYGSSGVQFYTQLKTVTSNWPINMMTTTTATTHSIGGSSSSSTSSLGGVNMPTYGKTTK